MQIRLTLSPVEKSVLPLNYNYAVQGLIYSLLSNEPEYADFLHDTGYESDTARFKLFTFGEIKGNYHIESRQIIPDGDIFLEIRSVSPRFCEILRKALLSAGELRLLKGRYQIKMVEVYDRKITKNSLCIFTASPIVVKHSTSGGRTLYISPEDEDFEDSINANLELKYEAAKGHRPGRGVCIEPLGKCRRVVTRFKSIWITAYHGRFRLGGEPACLDLLYQTGIGVKNSQGFGMFDIMTPKTS